MFHIILVHSQHLDSIEYIRTNQWECADMHVQMCMCMACTIEGRRLGRVSHLYIIHTIKYINHCSFSLCFFTCMTIILQGPINKLTVKL